VARVVLADDHPLFLQAMKAAVERAGIEVVGTAMRGDDLIDLMGRVDADLVLLDLAMPGYDGLECIDRLRASHPTLTLVVVSGTDDETTVRKAMEAGALCFVGKSTDPDDLAGAIRILLSDSIHLGIPRTRSGAATRAAPANGGASVLTRRELEILRLVSQGLSNGEMAKKLWVTEQTVKFHLSNIYRKIGVGNRTGASRWAQQQGLLDKSSDEDDQRENWRKMRALPSDAS
jgi:DNA-binding NarL/FixJ family response regulator